MNEISRIQAALRPHLPWHGTRLTFVALFLVALFRVETVNLDKLASVFANRAQSASSHKALLLRNNPQRQQARSLFSKRGHSFQYRQRIRLGLPQPLQRIEGVLHKI